MANAQLTLTDEDLATAQGKQASLTKSKPKAKMNALMMAGALDGRPAAASTAPTTPTKAAAATEAATRDPPNQKAALAAALLSIGDLDHALFIISRYPYLVGLSFSASPQLIADELLRIADYLIEPAYRAVPLKWQQDPSDDKEQSLAMPYGQRRPRWSPSEKRLVEPSAPKRFSRPTRTPGRQAMRHSPSSSPIGRPSCPRRTRLRHRSTPSFASCAISTRRARGISDSSTSWCASALTP
jgi:hypothetical protein